MRSSIPRLIALNSPALTTPEATSSSPVESGATAKAAESKRWKSGVRPCSVKYPRSVAR